MKKPTTGGSGANTSKGSGRPTSGNPKAQSRDGKAKRGKKISPEDGSSGATYDMESDASLTWVFLTQDQISELNALELEDSLTLVNLIIKLGGNLTHHFVYLQKVDNDTRTKFAKEKGFTPPQISTFFGLMKVSMEKSVEKGRALARSMQLFKQILANHTTSPMGDDESSHGVFSYTDMKMIVDFAMQG
ncbi:hypothetical protein HDU76_001451 [Blyttiomyces sp. JEL0837]|nr:hypothetical protein HDU76_001451 [Blyttiomyces sp. JEL0837]